MCHSFFACAARPDWLTQGDAQAQIADTRDARTLMAFGILTPARNLCRRRAHPAQNATRNRLRLPRSHARGPRERNCGRDEGSYSLRKRAWGRLDTRTRVAKEKTTCPCAWAQKVVLIYHRRRDNHRGMATRGEILSGRRAKRGVSRPRCEHSMHPTQRSSTWRARERKRRSSAANLSQSCSTTFSFVFFRCVARSLSRVFGSFASSETSRSVRPCSVRLVRERA